MENRIFILVVAAFTLLVALGVFFLFQKDESGDLLPQEEVVAIQEHLEKKTGESMVDVSPARETGREILSPREELTEEMAAMPASYREAMGGFKGRVLEQDGSPVAGAGVEVFGGHIVDFFHDIDAFMGEDPPDLKLRTVETVTEPDGTFLLRGVFPTAYYALGIDLNGVRSFGRIIDTLPNPGEIVDLGDIILDAFAILTGSVVDGQGNPVPGARVRATELPPIVFMSNVQEYREGGSLLLYDRRERAVIDPPEAFIRAYNRLPIPTTRTGQDGSFRLEGVPLGMVTVVADQAGRLTAREGPVSTARGGERDLGRIVLDKGSVIQGRVKDPKGNPVPGVEVRLGSVSGIKEVTVLQPPVFTDEQGVFRLGGFASIPSMAASRRYPEDPWTVTGPFIPGVEEPVVTLPPAYDLRVVAVLEDGNPVKGARMKIRYQGALRDLIFLITPKEPGKRLARPEEGIMEVKGLAPGKYEILVTAPGCAVVQETVVIKEEPLETKVVLKAACTARIRVLAEKDRLPVEWAEVYTSNDEEDWIFHPTRISRSRTDGEGLAVLKKLHPGKYNLTVSHPGYALTVDSLEVPLQEEKVVLLLPGGTVEGVVIGDRSSPEPPYMLVMEARSRRNNAEAESPRLTTTDREGRFKSTNLAPGEWRIHVEHRLFDKTPGGLFQFDNLRTLKRETVEVASGQTTYVEILLGREETGPGAEVSGRVTVDGAPATGAVVSCWSKRSYQATVDSAGRYNLGRITVGDCQLNLSNLPGSAGIPSHRVSRRIKVEENIPRYEDFDILTGSVTGRIVFAEEQSEARRVRIANQDKDAPYQAGMTVLADLQGNFIFDQVPIGIYTLTSGESEMLIEPMSGIKVLPGSSTGPLILHQLTPILVKGKVVLPEDTDTPRYLWLYCIPKIEGNPGGKMVEVSPDTGEFETKILTVGEYTGMLFGVRSTRFKPLEFEVPPGGNSNLVLVAKISE